METQNLFRGYIFMRSADPEALGRALRGISANAYLVARHGDTYAPLTDAEREWFDQVLEGVGTLKFSRGVIRDGVTVVEEGPLRGLERRIRKIDRHKRVAYVSANLADEETMMQAGLEITAKS